VELAQRDGGRQAPKRVLCLCGPICVAIEQFAEHCDGVRLVWGSDFGFGLADSIGTA
jgi:hypothetical protein